MLYSSQPGSTAPDKPEQASNRDNGISCELEDFVGDFDFSLATSKFPEDIIKQIRNSLDPLRITSDDEIFANSWMHAFGQGARKDSRHAVIAYLIPSDRADTDDKILVAGLNPRNAWNEYHEIWITRVFRLFRSVLNVLRAEEDKERKRTQARIQALEHARASVRRTATIMQYVVDEVDVGIFEYLPDGTLVHSNVSSEVMYECALS